MLAVAASRRRNQDVKPPRHNQAGSYENQSNVANCKSKNMERIVSQLIE